MRTYNTLKNSGIALIFGFLIACTPNHRVAKNKHCVNKLKRKLVGYWDYNADKNRYTDKKNMFHLVYSKKFQECLQSMPKSDLIEIFGIPTDIAGNRMFYRRLSNVNWGIFVNINNEGKYEDFGYYSILREADTTYAGEKNIVNYRMKY